MIVCATLDFQLRDRIGTGEGHNSEVYLAHDPQLDAQIVVKKIAKTNLVDATQYFAEARRLYDARHPNVVDVRYACEDGESVFLAMPHYVGGSVATLLRLGHMTNRDIVRYGLDFLHGLHHVHTRGLVHFDVKPSNVLIDHSRRAALGDFGIARYLRPDGLAAVDKLYFRHWPPEYLLAKDLPPAVDVYQAGLTLYRMCVGLSSLEDQAQGKTGEELAMLIHEGRFPDRKAFPLHTPLRLVRLIKTALEVDPANRFPTVLDMLIALAQVDQWLDWQCSRDHSDGSWIWELSSGGQLRTVALHPTEHGWSVIAKKVNESNGSVRTQHALSNEDLGWGRARTLVRKALRELE